MEQVREEKQRAEKLSSDCKMFEANLADNHSVKLRAGGTDRYYANSMDAVFQWYRCDRNDLTKNFLFDSVMALFGLDVRMRNLVGHIWALSGQWAYASHVGLRSNRVSVGASPRPFGPTTSHGRRHYPVGLFRATHGAPSIKEAFSKPWHDDMVR